MTRRTFLASLASATFIGAAPPASKMGIATTSFAIRRPKDTIEFLDYCHSLGAGGVQAPLTSLDAAYVLNLRKRAESQGMYLEVMAALPKEDASSFENIVKAAKQAGALAIRSACLGSRRYETFSNLDEWKKFVSDSKAAIARAVPIVERHKIPLAIENHKDWTAVELAGLLREYSSSYLGACLDAGNNIAMLDDPIATVEQLAPFAVSTHVKDMAVSEYGDGFLLAEVPLGEGMLDVAGIVNTIRKARPQTRMTLEMMTSHTLKVPCLTEKYWATWPEKRGKDLARTLAMVRKHARTVMPENGGPDKAAELRLEEDNVKRCLFYAREKLEL